VSAAGAAAASGWGVRLRKSLLGRSYEKRKKPLADVMDAARQGIARSTKRSG
jgi:hypothetical protein